MRILFKASRAVCLGTAVLMVACGQPEISTEAGGPDGEDIPIPIAEVLPEVQQISADATAEGAEREEVVHLERASDILLLSDDTQLMCPAGTIFISSSRLCTTPDKKRAVGPFTKLMITDCERYGGGKACQNQNWDYAFAVSLRGNKVCPKGAALNVSLNVCVEGSDAVGPFTKAVIARCTENKGTAAICNSLRIPASLLKATVSQPVQGSVNRKLFDYYSQSSNYQKVFNNVMNWYGTTSNGCVAFMSTALRQIGVNVPQNGYLGGEPISLVTLPFARHLREKLGWITIAKAADLQPGDIVFTVDAPGWPGFPWHTYMFHSWVDKAKGTGRVVDNQAFTHNRNIFGYGSYNFSPFAYALRAPN